MTSNGRAEILFTALIVLGFIFFIWFSAAQEARSYTKFCDTPVTTWDAVWLDLRIDECVKVTPP